MKNIRVPLVKPLRTTGIGRTIVVRARDKKHARAQAERMGFQPMSNFGKD